VQTGLGSFYDGVAHVALTPQDLLVTLGAALYAGARGAAAARATLFVLPAAWLAGSVLGALRSAEWAGSWATTVTFLVFGLLVAANARLPSPAVATLAAAAGLLHGCVNGATLGPRAADLPGIAGVSVAVFVVVALVSALVVGLRAAWSRIAVRVAGSWIAAAGILMLGWLMRGV
jgi:hydrogenase/urease accessory protein HupE